MLTAQASAGKINKNKGMMVVRCTEASEPCEWVARWQLTDQIEGLISYPPGIAEVKGQH